MTPNLLFTADDFLYGRARFRAGGAAEPTRQLVLLVLVFGPLYGAFMGSFQLDSPERLLQVLFAAVKMPILLFATSALCLPGFFIFNTVLGLREDFSDALRSILAGQAALSIALASLAPMTRFFYFSSSDYQSALVFNALMFTLATGAGHFVMLRRYRLLIAKHPKHRWALGAWLILFVFVGMQMGWTLRPFIGDPNAPVRFFREEPFTNAYVVILHLLTSW